MVNYLLVMLFASAINWLVSLPASRHNLRQVHQRESLREYIHQFSEKRHAVTTITDTDVISAFQDGLRKPSDLFCHLIMYASANPSHMITVIEQFSSAKDVEREQMLQKPHGNNEDQKEKEGHHRLPVARRSPTFKDRADHGWPRLPKRRKEKEIMIANPRSQP
ncbi:hypothetical protein GUJ93_ZPchr0008g12741 [Zizania palustris]|uniref:Retrotransposon gag domain-containing protein n=1 Tax=Zizania palustris TaxID=103762 RepID=A0A8J5RZJ9_ZIZPA|nr:hypothetical protein GUJ93_ZPchr0008g12741 [Zizania palustris]